MSKKQYEPSKKELLRLGAIIFSEAQMDEYVPATDKLLIENGWLNFAEKETDEQDILPEVVLVQLSPLTAIKKKLLQKLMNKYLGKYNWRKLGLSEEHDQRLNKIEDNGFQTFETSDKKLEKLGLLKRFKMECVSLTAEYKAYLAILQLD